jgi:hypothetical protein
MSPSAKDLIGTGVSDLQARFLGDNPPASITAAGTTSTDATAFLVAQNFNLITATGSDGVRLPAGTSLERSYIVVNTSASTVLVYPPAGGNLAGGTTDAALSLLSRKTAIFWRYSATGWAYNMSA